jgi:hypothetical protein
MSTAPIGNLAGSSFGAPLAQSAQAQGAAAQQIARERQQQRAAALEADRAAGIPEPDAQDMETRERDADGRQSWQRRPSTPEPPVSPAATSSSPLSGGRIDLTG